MIRDVQIWLFEGRGELRKEAVRLWDALKGDLCTSKSFAGNQSLFHVEYIIMGLLRL